MANCVALGRPQASPWPVCGSIVNLHGPNVHSSDLGTCLCCHGGAGWPSGLCRQIQTRSHGALWAWFSVGTQANANARLRVCMLGPCKHTSHRKHGLQCCHHNNPQGLVLARAHAARWVAPWPKLATCCPCGQVQNVFCGLLCASTCVFSAQVTAKPILVAGVGSRGQGCHQTQMQPPQVARSWHHSGACLGLWGPCWVPWLRNRQPLVGCGCPQATIDHATSNGCQATVAMALGVRWRFGAAPHGWAMLGWRLRGVCVVLGAAVGKARPFAHQRCPFAR